MTKHYGMKNKLVSAKLKEALNEIQALKEEKGQDMLRILAQASLQVSQNP